LLSACYVGGDYQQQPDGKPQQLVGQPQAAASSPTNGKAPLIPHSVAQYGSQFLAVTLR